MYISNSFQNFRQQPGAAPAPVDMDINNDIHACTVLMLSEFMNVGVFLNRCKKNDLNVKKMIIPSKI